MAATYTLNELADWIAAIALSILVYDETGSAFAVTALFVVNKFLPGLIVPPLSVRLERYATARLLGTVYVIEALALIALAVAAGGFWLPLVLALALVDGTLAAVGRAATRAATPALMEPAGLLREANAALNVGFASMNAGGPLLAGALVALLDPGPVIGLAAALFVVQALVIGTSRGIPHTELEPAAWHARLREGLSYVRGRPLLRTLLVGECLVFVLLTMVAPIEVVYAKDSLDAGDVGFGALATSWGIGMLVGSWLFARERNRPILGLVVVATVLAAVGYLGMAGAPGLAVACIASAVGGLGNGIQWVAVVTALQEATEDAFQGRIAGLLESVLTLGPGIGYPLGGLLTALLSPRAAFGVAGGGVLVMVLLGSALLRRDLRSGAATPEPAR